MPCWVPTTVAFGEAPPGAMSCTPVSLTMLVGFVPEPLPALPTMRYSLWPVPLTLLPRIAARPLLLAIGVHVGGLHGAVAIDLHDRAEGPALVVSLLVGSTLPGVLAFDTSRLLMGAL